MTERLAPHPSDRDEDTGDALTERPASWPTRIAVLLLLRSVQSLTLAWLRAYNLGWSFSDLWIDWEATHGPWRCNPYLSQPVSGAILAAFCAYAASALGVLHRPTPRTIFVAGAAGVWCVTLIGTHQWLVD